ncbi:MAG: hypothetical protein HY880_06750 [Deltaproteobacteria bacterium]|nr:hypothetical protein [Deltaproteobacteria bacterium]
MRLENVLLTDSNRLKGYLMRRFFLRFHMFLILSATFLSGILVSKILLSFNVNNMLIRFPLAVLFSYFAFFGFMKLWLLYLSLSDTESKTGHDVCDIGECIADAGGCFGDGCGDGIADTAGETASGIFEEGGIVLIILGALLAIVFGAGIYLIYEAPGILSEAAFEFLLAASLVKGMKRLDDPDWMQSVLRTTIVPFLVVLFVSLILAAVVKSSYPSAIKLSEVVKLIFSE